MISSPEYEYSGSYRPRLLGQETNIDVEMFLKYNVDF